MNEFHYPKKPTISTGDLWKGMPRPSEQKTDHADEYDADDGKQERR